MNHTGNAPKHLLALIGKRVQLQYTNDPYTGLRQGDLVLFLRLAISGSLLTDPFRHRQTLRIYTFLLLVTNKVMHTDSVRLSTPYSTNDSPKYF